MFSSVKILQFDFLVIIVDLNVRQKKPRTKTCPENDYPPPRLLMLQFVSFNLEGSTILVRVRFI